MKKIRSIEDLLKKERPSRGRRKRCKLTPLKKKRGWHWNVHPFIERSNRERANAVINLKNRIRLRQKGVRFLGGMELFDPERPQQYQQETCVYFPGTDKRIYWNAFVITAQQEFWAKVQDIADKRAWAMLSKEEKKNRAGFRAIPVEYDAWGHPAMYQMELDEEPYEQFGGMTLEQYSDELEKEIIMNEPPQVYESFQIDWGFEDGVGLYITVDAECLTPGIVELAIDRFFEQGEKDWRAEYPVARERLPYETEEQFLMTIPPERR